MTLPPQLICAPEEFGYQSGLNSNWLFDAASLAHKLL